MTAPAPRLHRAASIEWFDPEDDDCYDGSYPEVVLGDRWVATCCAAGPRRRGSRPARWRTFARARLVLAAHLAEAHGATVPPTALRPVVPVLCRGGHDDLDDLDDCEACCGDGITFMPMNQRDYALLVEAR